MITLDTQNMLHKLAIQPIGIVLWRILHVYRPDNEPTILLDTDMLLITLPGFNILLLRTHSQNVIRYLRIGYRGKLRENGVAMYYLA